MSGQIALQQVCERVVAPLDFGTIDGRPLTEGNRFFFAAHALQRQRVAPQNVALQNKANGCATRFLRIGFVESAVLFIKNAEQPFATLLNVIFKNIDAINTGDHQHRIAFIFELALAVAFFNDSQFAMKNFSKKISGTASGFEKAGFDALCFALHQIEHRIHFPFGSKHLSMIRHPFFGLYLAQLFRLRLMPVARKKRGATSTCNRARHRQTPTRKHEEAAPTRGAVQRVDFLVPQNWRFWLGNVLRLHATIKM